MFGTKLFTDCAPQPYGLVVRQTLASLGLTVARGLAREFAIRDPRGQMSVFEAAKGCVHVSGLQNGSDLRSKFRDASVHDVPDQFEVDAKVVVNQTVSHAGDRPPLHRGMPRSEVVRNASPLRR